MRHRVLSLLLVGATSGCATLSNLESAQTLPRGKWTVGLEGRYLLTRSDVGSDDQRWLNLAVRRGMSDGFELGARAGMGRPELFGKWRLRGKEERVALAFSQTLGVWRFVGPASHWQAWSRSAVPIGVSFGASELVLTPQLHVAAGHADVGLWGVGFIPSASVGFAWRPWRWLAVMPQLTFGYSLANAATGGAVLGRGFALEAALAVTAGGAEGF